MRCFAIFAFLFSASPAFPAWQETGNNLVRFVCQRYSGGEPRNEVIVVEQLSVDTVDGSLHIAPDDQREGGRGEENRFRMKMYMDSSLISSERTKEEIIKDLLIQPASLDYDGVRMEYEGVGSRFVSEFEFVSDDERIVFHMYELRDLEAFLHYGAAGGFFVCEEPELFPEKVWVED